MRTSSARLQASAAGTGLGDVTSARLPHRRVATNALPAIPPRQRAQSATTDRSSRPSPRSKPLQTLLGYARGEEFADTVDPAGFIKDTVKSYFQGRQQEADLRRESFQRQTRMMLSGTPDNQAKGGACGRRDTAPLPDTHVALPKDGSYLTLDSHQQRIVLQTTFRSRPESSQTTAGGRQHQIHIPISQAAPAMDPFVSLPPISGVLPGPESLVETVMSEVRGYFDESDGASYQRRHRPAVATDPSDFGADVSTAGLSHAPTGFLNPNKLHFLETRAEELMLREQTAQQQLQRQVLVSEEEAERCLIPQQADRDRMSVIASWLKTFPPGRQLEMLALQQKYFPSALSKQPATVGATDGDVRRGVGGRKAVIVDVPEGAGTRPFRRSAKRKKSLGKEGLRPPASELGGAVHPPRRRSSATLADIDSFFASIADEGDEASLPNILGRSKKSRAARKSRSSRVGDTCEAGPSQGIDNYPPLAPSVVEDNAAAPQLHVAAQLVANVDVNKTQKSTIPSVHATVGGQVREALSRVGVVYSGFTSTSLYAADPTGSRHTQPAVSHWMREGPSDPEMPKPHEVNQQDLVQFSSISPPSSSRAHSLFTVTSGDAISDGARSTASRSSPSLRSFSEAQASVSGMRTRDDEGADETVTVSASEGSKSRSHSRAASVASAFSGGVKSGDAVVELQPEEAPAQPGTPELFSKEIPVVPAKRDTFSRPAKHVPSPAGTFNIRKHPQAMAAATTAASRIQQQTRDSLRGLVESELQARLMCNWFGAPSSQLLASLGLQRADIGDGGIIARFCGNGGSHNNNNSKNKNTNDSILAPSLLLSHRLLSRLSLPTLPSSQPAISFVSSGIDVTPPPPSASAIVSTALATFDFLFERTMTCLISGQLAFASAVNASHIDSVDSRSKTSPTSARHSLAAAIDAQRVADALAAHAQAASKASGLRKAQLAAQAAGTSAAQASAALGRLLDVVLPPFLRPEQKEKHMLLLSDAKPPRGTIRGRAPKTSVHLRPNPLLQRSDLFVESLIESLHTLADTLRRSDGANRTNALASAGERIGLATRAQGSPLAPTSSERPSLRQLCMWVRAQARQHLDGLGSILLTAELSTFSFGATSDVDISGLPLLLLGIPNTLWDSPRVQLESFLDALEAVVSSNTPVSDWAPPQDARAVSLNVSLEEVLLRMPLRLLLAIREERTCRSSLRFLLSLCETVVMRRYAAALSFMKRQSLEGFDASRDMSVVTVGMGAHVPTDCNVMLVDALLTTASADLFHSAASKARIQLSNEELSESSDCARPLPLSCAPSEVSRSSFVHFIQLFNTYSPQSNSWIRASAFSVEETAALRIVAARAHASSLVFPPADSLTTTLGASFCTSPLSLVGPLTLSCLFTADDALAELGSIQKRAEALSAQLQTNMSRIDSLSETLSAINFQILVSNQNLPNSSVAAAAARRMSVVSTVDPSSEDSPRSSFSQSPHTAVYGRLLAVEVERQQVIDETTALEAQLRTLGDEQGAALDALCKAQCLALLAACVDAAASAMCQPAPEATFDAADVVDFLVSQDASELRRENLATRIAAAQPSRRSVGVQPQAVGTVEELCSRLPPQLQLTPLSASRSGAQSDQRPSLAPRLWTAGDFLMPFSRSYCHAEVIANRERTNQPERSSGEDDDFPPPPRSDGIVLSTLRGARARRLGTELSSWLSEVDTMATSPRRDTDPVPLQLVSDGLVSGAVLVGLQEQRLKAFSGSENLAGADFESVRSFFPLLPMVPLRGPRTSPSTDTLQGVRLNYLFAWRVSGIVLRFVACRLLPIVARCRRARYNQSLQPHAAFVIQCAFRRLLQRRRIRARAAVRRIERFLYGKIQTILARKSRALAVLRRAMRLWHKGKQARLRIAHSLSLMRDEVIRRRMQCMHAKKVLTQLKRLQEERTVLIHRCALQGYRILSDERSAWRTLCEDVRSLFFEGLAELLANQTERECLRVIVGADEGGCLETAYENSCRLAGTHVDREADDVSPLLPPESMRRNSDAAFAFFKAYGRRLSGVANDDASSSSASLQRQEYSHSLSHSTHAGIGAGGGRRMSKGRDSQIALSTLVDALNPHHRRSIIDLLGASTGAAVGDRRSSLAAAETSIAAWRRSRANSVFAFENSRAFFPRMVLAIHLFQKMTLTFLRMDMATPVRVGAFSRMPIWLMWQLCGFCEGIRVCLVSALLILRRWSWSIDRPTSGSHIRRPAAIAPTNRLLRRRDCPCRPT